jgi:hypothetical protein
VEAELGDARVRAVLRALFGPVAEDYAGTGRVLAAAHRSGAPLPTPAEVATHLGGAHLPDVEGAFEDLVERGGLVRGEDGAHDWGSRAGALGDYADACRPEGPEGPDGPDRHDAVEG